VFCSFGDGGESLSRWLVERDLVLVGGLGQVFVWIETLAGSSRWHHEGCLQDYNTVGAKC
jgi:hypothetical protein